MYLPKEIIPSKRVLLLRFKNRFETLVQSLLMADVTCTSAYPITWVRKEWNSQEERMAKEVDGIYIYLFLIVNNFIYLFINDYLIYLFNKITNIFYSLIKYYSCIFS